LYAPAAGSFGGNQRNAPTPASALRKLVMLFLSESSRFSHTTCQTWRLKLMPSSVRWLYPSPKSDVRMRGFTLSDVVKLGLGMPAGQFAVPEEKNGAVISVHSPG